MGDARDRAVLRLGGELNVRRIAALKEELVAALAGSDRLRLDLEGAGAVDLTFVQLLCALRCAARREGKDLRLERELPAALQGILAAAGFAAAASCPDDCRRDCLWDA